MHVAVPWMFAHLPNKQGLPPQFCAALTKLISEMENNSDTEISVINKNKTQSPLFTIDWHSMYLKVPLDRD